METFQTSGANRGNRSFIKELWFAPLSGYGPIIFVNRPVRTRLPLVVWGLGEKNPRLPDFFNDSFASSIKISDDLFIKTSFSSLK